jgi:uncharacterized cupredoxin-like copper-binding protein
MRFRCGLAALLALGAMTSCFADARAEGPSVDVTIHYSRFHPSSLEVREGETVRFVVHNTDPIDHEFLIGDEHMQRIHENGTEAHHGARPGEISVPAGTTRSTTYTFTEPGSLIFGCHLPGHYRFGMRGVIQVTSN